MEQLPEDRPVIIYTFHFNGFVLNHKLSHAFEGFHKFRIPLVLTHRLLTEQVKQRLNGWYWIMILKKAEPYF